jgi:hypothetical protein
MEKLIDLCVGGVDASETSDLIDDRSDLAFRVGFCYLAICLHVFPLHVLLHLPFFPLGFEVSWASVISVVDLGQTGDCLEELPVG